MTQAKPVTGACQAGVLELYDYELSGNCYKVRLLLHWLGLEYTRIPVDFHPGRGHRSAHFIDQVNPRGQLPVLLDGDFLLPDAQAILVYLASAYDPHGRWWFARRRVAPGWFTRGAVTASQMPRRGGATHPRQAATSCRQTTCTARLLTCCPRC